ncbi:MAG: hypothetical protein IFNCLDLE_00629 [Ignavibacteriaceae bacterium]|nr:hypothetical protein [Ignavibacteriaceae bacterium]OQY72516.1 MAG: hypothetical protein B6D45_09085 [Ignavibacteriales bacterium UTCHB3]
MVSMKKLLLLALFLIISAEVKPQTFQFFPQVSNITDTLGSELIFEFTLKNISATPQTIYIIRTENTMPSEDWSSSLCFDQGCFAPFVDSVATTPDFMSSPIAPNEQREFSVHIFTFGSHGSGTVTVVGHSMENPGETYTHTLHGSTSVVSVKDEGSVISDYSLEQNYPNPFNPSTVINFTLPKAGYTSLVLYDIMGKEVMTALDGYYEAGRHSYRLDASELPSGVYLYRLTSGSFVSAKKLILEK